MLAITRRFNLAVMRTVAAAFDLDLYVFCEIRPVRPDATANSEVIFCNS